jgi:hypothetical protein
MWVTMSDELIAPLAIRRLRVWHDDPVVVICEPGVSYSVLEALSLIGCRNVLATSLKRDTEGFLFDRWQQVYDHLPGYDTYIRIDPDTEIRGRLMPPSGEWFGARYQCPIGWTVWGGIGGFSNSGLQRLLRSTRVGHTDTYVNSVGVEVVSADLLTTRYMGDPVDWPEVCAGSVFRPEMATDAWQAVHPCLEKWIPQHLWHRMYLEAPTPSWVYAELFRQLGELGIKRPIREVRGHTNGYDNALKVDAEGGLHFGGLRLGDLFTDGLRATWTSEAAISERKRLMRLGYLKEQVT